jgi:diguanylate cyclase (GGDEF)-like protein
VRDTDRHALFSANGGLPIETIFERGEWGMSDQRHPDRDELATLRTVLGLIPQTVLIVDGRTGRIVDANPAACRALETARALLIGRAWNTVSERLGDVPLRPADSAGRWLIAVGHSSDSGHLPQASPSRDPLTGLANRDALWTRALPDAGGRRPRSLALLFVDLNGFKQVNDTWGHIIGDRVLQTVAARLADNVRPADLVVRWGGDEFVVLVQGTIRRRDLERLSRRVARAIRQPIAVQGRELQLTASIGIAQGKLSERSIEELIAEADLAMYRAKMQAAESGAGPRTTGSLALGNGQLNAESVN